jgi:type IV pilus assembly protein PilX
MDVRLPNTNERGIALVISMLILLVMTLLGLVLMAGASLNRSLAGNDQRMRQSLNIAEAGIGEAEARIANQETLMNPTDPVAGCQVFNTIAGSVPVVGADTTALATGQTVGSYLNYTTATRTPDVLTIGWKKNTAGTQVMKYDGTKSPAIQTASGIPIYAITSTGRVGQARRTIVAEVIQKPYVVLAKGAFTANTIVTSLGNAVVCGYNHSADTPYDDGKKGRDNPTPIPPNDPDYCHDNEVGGGDVPGVWGGDLVTNGGAAQPFGNPSGIAQNQGKNNFYTGPWDALGMSQADFWQFVGAPTNPSAVSNWNGILYVDDDGVTQNQSCSLGPNGVDAEGFMYVDGDLHLNSNFHYKGFIYVEGDITVNGTAWILGGIVARGKTTIKINGGMTVLYSSDAITQELTKYGSQFVTLSWREK